MIMRRVGDCWRGWSVSHRPCWPRSPFILGNKLSSWFNIVHHFSEQSQEQDKLDSVDKSLSKCQVGLLGFFRTWWETPNLHQMRQSSISSPAGQQSWQGSIRVNVCVHTGSGYGTSPIRHGSSHPEPPRSECPGVLFLLDVRCTPHPFREQ